ncbi:MAG: ABC transporter substrate-binding protein [Ignavibacteriales bacterium UTCHB2]|jgi:phospholipid/cholesterol/gamma-HCH transport system substrate-binding protein|nr:MAG: mce related protein [Ignavibacteria bacterium ADurb.Bin266]OQY71041.1 MAG: ABC transporter substrate-binding protein [Ignavibacteriales bacterium UTCHB2]HQI42000.1 MlaD family protein [Ignavibacteriaceae bacterium]HQJ45886.1 MlaD family protein [Ignavibacteriaceae bacterium]
MKNERKTEIKVGITVVFGLIILLWIFGWAKNFSLSSNSFIIKVKFDNVSGLEVGDQVTVNGMRKGFVQDMEVGPNNVLVELSIEKDIVLKEDATFAVSMLDLMGGKKVEVFPGKSEKDFDKTKIAQGTFYSDIPSAMSLFGSVQDDLVTVLKDVKISLSSLNKIVSDDKFNEDLKKSLSNLVLLTDKINAMLNENRNEIKTLTANAVELSEKTNKLLTDNADNINILFSDLKSLVKKSDELLTDLNTLTSETINQQNNIGKLLYDKEIFKKLNTTLERIDELTSILIDQLKNEGINVDANIF